MANTSRATWKLTSTSIRFVTLSKPILDFITTNDVGGDASATPLLPLLFESSPASTVAAAPFLTNPIYSSPAPTDLDALFLACCDTYERETKRPRLEPCKPTKSRAFALPQRPRKKWNKPSDDMTYCIRIWNEWRYHRQVNYSDSIPEIGHIDLPELAQLLAALF